jgi:hypothetical protein
MMNERIKELAEQAGIETEFDNYGEVRLSMAYGSALEKFTELVLKECEKVAKNPQWYGESPSNGWRNPIRHVCNVMKEHFGVEE